MQARPELFDEVGHPGLAARNAVGFEQTHLPPTQAKAKPDRVINFFGCGDPVLDQPKRLAPDRFEKAIGNMCVYFLAHLQWFHADFSEHRMRARGRGIVTDQFDKRQQIDRIERVRDENLVWAQRPLLKLGRFEP